MNTYDYIKYWDDNLVEQHVGSETNIIIDYFQKLNKKSLTYLDIGANSGKYYDILSRYFTLDMAIMVEGSYDLYRYLILKFQKKNCKIYNYILSDMDGTCSFSDINFEAITTIEHMNLGLSKSSSSNHNTKICRNAGKFFLTHILNKNINIDLIKIDTENRDYHILKSITPYINKLKSKPVICFENNYHNDMSKNDAQTILNNFCKNNLYAPIMIDSIQWSSVFLWP